MINEKVRVAIFKSDVTQKQIAERLDISTFKMCRLLKRELSKEQQNLILDTLREIEQDRANEPVKL